MYRRGDAWAALQAPRAGFEASPVFDFAPGVVTIDRDLTTPVDVSKADGKFMVFSLHDLVNYETAMKTALRQMLTEMPMVRQRMS